MALEYPFRAGIRIKLKGYHNKKKTLLLYFYSFFFFRVEKGTSPTQNIKKRDFLSQVRKMIKKVAKRETILSLNF